MNDCDCEFSMWLEEANSSEMTGALVSYRNELEDALDRIKQLDLIIRDMKAYSFHSSSTTDNESECSCEDHMVEGKCYWVEDVEEGGTKCDCCDHQC